MHAIAPFYAFFYGVMIAAITLNAALLAIVWPLTMLLPRQPARPRTPTKRPSFKAAIKAAKFGAKFYLKNI